MEITALQARLDRAKRIPDEDIHIDAVERKCGYTFAFGWVRSQTAKRYGDDQVGYGQIAMFNEHGKLVGCQCLVGPDLKNTKLKGKGVPSLRGIRVCKHVLAFAMKVHRVL